MDVNVDVEVPGSLVPLVDRRIPGFALAGAPGLANIPVEDFPAWEMLLALTRAWAFDFGAGGVGVTIRTVGSDWITPGLRRLPGRGFDGFLELT